ncbi:hypothetical protein CEN49_04395 [Fischerella thermalis CCMEE 5273]|nr:hypothetical protein CEN49_04395 [Fischerella thermalis CCMEE 5273]
MKMTNLYFLIIFSHIFGIKIALVSAVNPIIGLMFSMVKVVVSCITQTQPHKIIGKKLQLQY